MIQPTRTSSSDSCIDIRNNGCLTSWISHIIQQQQQQQNQQQQQCLDDRILSSSHHQPTTNGNNNSNATVIVEQDNAKRPMNPISEAYMDDIPALVPFYNTDHRNYTKRRMLCYNQKAKNNNEKKVKVVSVEKKNRIRRKTAIPSNSKNSPSTTTTSSLLSCSSLVLDRWENQCSNSLKSMSSNNTCSYPSMPSLPVRLSLESAMKNNASASTSSSSPSTTNPFRNHRKLVLSLTSCSPSTNDMAPKKPLRKPLLLPRIPCLDEDNNDVDSNSNDGHQQRVGRHRASTIELLDEALNLIAITNQIIDNADAADSDDDRMDDEEDEKA